jgi:hypothetical protein
VEIFRKFIVDEEEEEVGAKKTSMAAPYQPQ